MVRAIILAAGQGTRLGNLTASIPKCLVSYQGRPILSHIISALQLAGISDLVLVAGYYSEQLKPFGFPMYVNERYHTTNMVESLFCAEEMLNTDVIISYADIVYTPQIVRKLIDHPSDLAVVVDRRWQELWKQRMANPLEDAETLRLHADETIIELGDKPSSLEEIQGQYIGLLKFNNSILPEVRQFYHLLDRSKTYRGRPFSSMYMTTFLQLIIDHLMPVKAVLVDGGWVEIDSPSDLKCKMIL